MEYEQEGIYTPALSIAPQHVRPRLIICYEKHYYKSSSSSVVVSSSVATLGREALVRAAANTLDAMPGVANTDRVTVITGDGVMLMDGTTFVALKAAAVIVCKP